MKKLILTGFLVALFAPNICLSQEKEKKTRPLGEEEKLALKITSFVSIFGALISFGKAAYVHVIATNDDPFFIKQTLRESKITEEARTKLNEWLKNFQKIKNNAPKTRNKYITLGVVFAVAGIASSSYLFWQKNKEEKEQNQTKQTA